MEIAPESPELQGTRIQLQQALDELDAVKYEKAQLEQTLFELGTRNDGESRIMQIWQNCLGGKLFPKAHWIDALAKTTRWHVCNSELIAAQRSPGGS